MAQFNQEFIDGLILKIKSTEEPESVTNTMLAAVLEHFSDNYRELLDASAELDLERAQRQAADAALSSTIDTLTYALSQVNESLKVVRQAADANTAAIDALTGENASRAIDNFNEILRFLQGLKDDENLLDLLNRTISDRVAAHRREAGVYPFDGYCADVDMLDAEYEGQVLWDKSRSCFMECADLDENAWTDAGEDFCLQGHEGAIPRTDRLYRAGGVLYRVRGSEISGFDLVRLVDEEDWRDVSAAIGDNAEAIRTEQKRREANCNALSLRIEAKAADIGIYPFHGFESTSTLDDVADDYAEGAVVFVNGPATFMMKTRTEEWVAAGSDYNTPDGGAKSDRIFRLGQGFYIVKNASLRRIVNADDLQSVQRLLESTMNGIANGMASRVAAHRREAGIYPFDGVYTSREEVDEPSVGMIVWDSQISCFLEYAEGSWRYPENEEYHTFPGNGPAIPRTDRLYRAGGALYRVRGTEDSGFELVRLVDELDADDARNAWVIDQFNAYCVCHIPSVPEPVRAGGYNPQTRLFECNGITDIGLDEAKAMLAYAPLTRFITPGHGRNKWELFGVSESSLRTVFPIYQKNGGEGTGSFDKMFLRWGALETVRFVACNSLSCQEMFAHCPKLRTVYNLYVGSVKNTVEMFGGCTALEYVELNALSASISFKSSQKLNLASLEYITARRAGSNLITITVHPDTFAKLTGDTTNEAAAALTPEELAEWTSLTETASAKNISFATV